ncbi:hypothetical protein BJ138DRAFT_1081255 [Hygrophoropsis aurantiaca]|uniref:Uncharacterized protein n=1 Tax=Hygrophoropsis aurantiaca TaxID=72124 RepID=A0ACB8AJL8_9AGAM|nr:hypothetical protein BJ138DRAFT_1081255 [Hygrophoropsis aurantiaca]
MSRHKQQPITLPKTLLDQLNENSGQPSSRAGRRGYSHINRKEERKQERVDRKKRKAEHYATSINQKKRKPEDDEHMHSPKSKKRKTQQSRSNAPGHPKSPAKHDTNAPVKSDAKAPLPIKPKGKITTLAKLASKKTPSISRSRLEEEEDAYIAYLEAKLGYTGRGKQKQANRHDDGLDDLFDLTDSFVPATQIDRDLELDEVTTDSDNAGARSSHDSERNSGPAMPVDEEWNGFEENPSDGDSEISPNLIETAPSEAKPPPPAGRYIPPSLRKPDKEGTNESEQTLKLTRQLKGLINKMSEQNMSSILESIEEVYRKHRRHDVTSTLSSLVIEGISSHSVLLDSYVVLHAAFISSLHKLIGIEFAAFFVQNVVSSYEQHLASVNDKVADDSANVEDQGKECSNLIVLLSELYNFQVVSCILVYDIIRDLLNNAMGEFHVELLLKILRNSGQQLRQDDPSALKDIVTIAQNKLANQSDTLGSRTRFMLETLNNLKNNKIKKNAAQHQGGGATERMKKFLSGLGKKQHVLAHGPLRVSLEDLHSAESKGKWWLVGAAWGGDPLLDQKQNPSQLGKAAPDDGGAGALDKLARKQGMNTDIRRSIFIVLMSSDDYLDACERLAQLNLTEVQQREIIRVNLHCCGNEKSYNPYYTLVCQHLCQRSHSYKITLQFCLWDFLRDLGETNVGGAEVIKNFQNDGGGFDVKSIQPSRMRNVAKAYAWWIAKDCCSLTVFKPVDFTSLKPQAQLFMKELLLQVLVASQVSSPMLSNASNDYPSSRNRGNLETIFLKASRVENLGLGLIYFISEAFRDEERFIKWGCTVAKETLQTGMDYVPRL